MPLSWMEYTLVLIQQAFQVLDSTATTISKMGRKNIALKLLLVMAVLFFCMSQVKSDANIQDHPTGSKVVKGPNRRLLAFVDCGAKCRVRCSLHSRPKICHRACGTCCSRCKCVPPGTSGNRAVCGRCYTDMITHGNKPKCP